MTTVLKSNGTDVKAIIFSDKQSVRRDHNDIKCGHIYINKGTKIFKYCCLYCSNIYEDVLNFCQHIMIHVHDAEKAFGNANPFKVNGLHSNNLNGLKNGFVKHQDDGSYIYDDDDDNEEFIKDEMDEDLMLYDENVGGIGGDINTDDDDDGEVELFKEMDEWEQIAAEAEVEIQLNSEVFEECNYFKSIQRIKNENNNEEFLKPKTPFLNNADELLKPMTSSNIFYKNNGYLETKKINDKMDKIPKTFKQKIIGETVITLIPEGIEPPKRSIKCIPKTAKIQIHASTIIPQQNLQQNLQQNSEDQHQQQFQQESQQEFDKDSKHGNEVFRQNQQPKDAKQSYQQNARQQGTIDFQQKYQPNAQEVLSNNQQNSSPVIIFDGRVTDLKSSVEYTNDSLNENSNLTEMTSQNLDVPPEEKIVPVPSIIVTNSISPSKQCSLNEISLVMPFVESLKRSAEDMDETKCPACGKNFRSSFSLAVHKRSHYLEKKSDIKLVHKCPKCKGLFNNIRDLKEHIKIEHFPEGFVCRICNAKLITLNLLEAHMRRQHLINKYKCRFCGKSFDGKPSYEEHANAKGGCGYNFKCKLCSRNFIAERSLQIHMGTHNKVKILRKCPYCDKLTYRLGSHIKTHYPKPNSHKKCTMCSKHFNLSTTLARHMRLVHKKGPNTQRKRAGRKKLNKTEDSAKENKSADKDSCFITSLPFTDSLNSTNNNEHGYDDTEKILTEILDSDDFLDFSQDYIACTEEDLKSFK